jgi:hypothetical protein
MTATALTHDQKLDFLRDGFIVLRGVVARDLTAAARRSIYIRHAQTANTRPYHGFDDDALPNLINESALGQVLRSTLGQYDPPQSAFAATILPQPKPQQVPPNFGWQPHVDGWWYKADLPSTPDEVDSWQAPRTHHFGNADAAEIGANKTPFFQDPECTLSIGSFAAFVGVALNDQTEFGNGNLCLLPGAHEEVEKFFRTQRDAGGVVGPEGPGWPRLSPVGNDGVTLTSLPLPISEMFLADAETTPDGRVWFQPEPMLLEEGDAVIALHACPHNNSLNLGSDPRLNVYFRVRHQRAGAAVVRGDSDHPDRGWDGEFLTYDTDFDPWRTSIDLMCDHWSEWDGMQEVVAAQRAGNAAQP